jgi:hypothetical protein
MDVRAGNPAKVLRDEVTAKAAHDPVEVSREFMPIHEHRRTLDQQRR